MKRQGQHTKHAGAVHPSEKVAALKHKLRESNNGSAIVPKLTDEDGVLKSSKVYNWRQGLPWETEVGDAAMSPPPAPQLAAAPAAAEDGDWGGVNDPATTDDKEPSDGEGVHPHASKRARAPPRSPPRGAAKSDERASAPPRAPPRSPPRGGSPAAPAAPPRVRAPPRSPLRAAESESATTAPQPSPRRRKPTRKATEAAEEATAAAARAKKK